MQVQSIFYLAEKSLAHVTRGVDWFVPHCPEFSVAPDFEPPVSQGPTEEEALRKFYRSLKVCSRCVRIWRQTNAEIKQVSTAVSDCKRTPRLSSCLQAVIRECTSKQRQLPEPKYASLGDYKESEKPSSDYLRAVVGSGHLSVSFDR